MEVATWPVRKRSEANRLAMLVALLLPSGWPYTYKASSMRTTSLTSVPAFTMSVHACGQCSCGNITHVSGPFNTACTWACSTPACSMPLPRKHPTKPQAFDASIVAGEDPKCVCSTASVFDKHFDRQDTRPNHQGTPTKDFYFCV